VLNRIRSNLRAAQHSKPLEIYINTLWLQAFTATRAAAVSSANTPDIEKSDKAAHTPESVPF
jgi:hypothetical protein|tara:strand:+ start:734 stop:919 length:186 start_codon:yes stop_codon:yes gene_type:complete